MNEPKREKKEETIIAYCARTLIILMSVHRRTHTDTHMFAETIANMCIEHATSDQNV